MLSRSLLEARIASLEMQLDVARGQIANSSDGPSGASDHGALTGLSDDDHAQYHTNARGDARYSQLGHTHDYEAAGAAAAAIAAHLAVGNPHSQYITPADASSAFAALSHVHAIASITGLQGALDGKQAAGSYAAASHTHAIADVTNLQSTLDGKQAAGSYAAASHSHSASDITSGTFSPDRLGSGSALQVLRRNAGNSALEFAAVSVGGTPTKFSQSTAQQGAGFASDTYLTGSFIVIPSGSLLVGTRYRLIFDVSKTAAGTAAPVVTVRVGVNGSTGDTGRCTLTFLAQTAVADDGTFEVFITVRAVGATAVLQAVAQCRHRLSTTGLQNQPGTTVRATSAAFDITPANTGIGVSVNGGASAAWTVQLVQACLENLT